MNGSSALKLMPLFNGCVTYLSLEPYPGEGVGPFHSREVPLPLTRDYFEALTPETPKRASSPLIAINRIAGRVGTGTEGDTGAGATARVCATLCAAARVASPA